MRQKNSTDVISFEGVNNCSSAIAIAISAGDLSRAVRQQVKKILKENRNDILKAIYSGLQELLERKLISAIEFEQLKNVCKHLINSVRGKEDGEDAFLLITKIYQEMLTNHESNPSALAIASVANSAFNFEKSSPLTITPESTAAGAVTGAVIGAAMGALLGGGVGAGIGAAIGGAAGAAIGWCNEEGK